jgi:hypothetical protein
LPPAPPPASAPLPTAPTPVEPARRLSLGGAGAEANKIAAVLAGGAAVAALIGVFQTWLRLRIGGVAVKGGVETGWNGRDGKTVAVAAVAALVVAAALRLGRTDLWLTVTLFVAGAVTVVVTIVNVADATSKAKDIENEFGIAAVRVQAQVGAGLWLVGAAGCAMLAAGLIARRSGS